MTQLTLDSNMEDSWYPPREIQSWPNVDYIAALKFQCELAPEKLAVVSREGTLTYKQLEELSLTWAKRLVKAGVGVGDKVIVCLGRSHKLPAILLGVLRSGACFVPVDPGFPADRIAVITEDSGASAAVCEPENRNLFDDASEIPVILADESFDVSGGHILPDWHPDDPAYLLFTSGSTGRPKGVEITRGAMVNFLVSMLQEPGLERSDRVLGLTTISFDISILELFLPLLAGASVYLASREDGMDPEKLIGFIENHYLTVLQATPATWRLLYDFGWRARKSHKILCGGEAFPSDLAEWLLDNAGEVWNMYGPTEATVWASCHRLTGEDVASGQVAIGKALPNLVFRVCDPRGKPAETGQSGELWIGGIGISPGYYGRPELNNEVFVTLTEGGLRQRYYRTGDLVRTRNDGQLVYVDRLDNQIKIHGYRVEPGEIEAALKNVQGVQDAVVLKSQRNDVDGVLVGCIRPENAPSGDLLGRHLAEFLPDYMIPGIWLHMGEFPETPNRKVDRKKIRELVETRETAEFVSAPPEYLPENLARISMLWEQVVGRAPRDSDSSFLALGGHSLAAARLSSLVNREFDCWIEPVKFIAHPTLAEHRKLIEDRTTHQPVSFKAGPEYSTATSGLSDLIPASSSQSSMWYAGELQGSHAIYNESEAYLVEERLDASLLEKTLAIMQARHVAFRMAPVISGLELSGWKVSSTETIPLDIHGVKDHDDISGLTQEEAQTPFDFQSGKPLIRFALFRLVSGCDLLQFTAHHTIIDGLSEHLVWNEICEIYQILKKGGQLQTEHFSDEAFANVLRKGAVHSEDDIAYWRSVFETPAPSLELKTDYQRSPEFTYEALHEEMDLGSDFGNQLINFANDVGSTPFQVLLAVYFVFLERYAQQEEYVVGVPVSGRHSNLNDKAIGLFINTVPVRERVLQNEKFNDFLVRIGKVTIKAMEHDLLPFDALVENVNPPRESGRTPLYQTVFTLDDRSGVKTALSDGVPWYYQNVQTGFAPTELVFFSILEGGSLKLVLQGSKDLFKRKTLQRMLGHFRNLMISAISNPEISVQRLEMLDKGERAWIEERNDTERPYPRDESIASCFEEVVNRWNNAVAIEYRDQSWSYAELATQSDRVCQVLREKGVKAGDPVGVVAYKHPDTVIALIGVARAGATYVPLDMSYPPDRVEQMIAQSGMKVVLTHESGGHEKAMFGQDCKLVPIRTLPSDPGSQTGLTVKPTDRAYIMFTSGSTGVPKGIEVSHRNVLRLVKNTDFMPLNHDTRFLMNSPVPFDASTLEIWGPLLNGGTLVIPEQERLNIVDMERVLSEKNVNSAFFTTTLFQQFANEAAHVFSPLRYLITGGEVLSPRCAKKVLLQHPHIQLVNGYGPTENTTFSCCYSMCHPDDVLSPVPIGKPIANSRVHILDRGRQPVPVGVPGELYVGGDGVAIGYLNSPSQTKAAFLKTEIDRSGPVYKTGDMGRWRDDGNIEFLGRADNQVKIRGHRIELEEITLKITSAGVTDQAYTTTWLAPSGETLIVAYFVSNKSSVDPQGTIRSILQASLPAYMVPQYIIEIDRFPISPTGKVDRHKLPDPSVKKSGSEKVCFDNFEGEVEKVLAEIWQDVLRRSDFGRTDDFFLIGGSSLKALQVFSQIKQRFDIDLPLATLLHCSTISALATELNRYLRQDHSQANNVDDAERWDSLVVLADKDTKVSPIVCTHAVGGNVLSYRGLLSFDDIPRPVVGFQSRSLDGETEPLKTINEMAQSYVSDLLAAGYSGPFTLMGGSMGGNIALEMAHILNQKGMEVDWVILLDTIGPKARHLIDVDNQPEGVLRRIYASVLAWSQFYFRLSKVMVRRFLGLKVPYILRPFWIEENNKTALFRHIDKPYYGNVLLIRAPEGKGRVYSVPSLGWEGILKGRVITEYIDAEHGAFMESDTVHTVLHRFLRDNTTEN